jgi:uncharacterized protein with von Willebrand factor type A (vWA) domain
MSLQSSSLSIRTDGEGRLADNIVHFARALRKAGMRVGPSAVVDAIEAVIATGIGGREDFYWTLHAVFVKRREDHATFDEAFRLFWRSRELIEKMIAMFSPRAAASPEKARPRAAESRVAQAMFGGAERGPNRMAEEIEIDAHLTVSGNEVLRAKDFAQMTAEELATARAAIATLTLPDDRLRTRRFRPDRLGGRIDPRSMMRRSLRTGGELILPEFRSHRFVHPPLVAIADISGSMSQYTRMLLHFLHVLTASRRRVHTFVFGTRLTNLTRQMRHRDPDEALAACSMSVKDWSGGTRIGDTLREFNRLWSRRVLSQGAVVLLITDGLERDDVEGLAEEMDRLHRSCRRLIWLNPLLRFEGFEARARGVRVMLPHVDEFRPVHSLDAISDLCAALSENRPRGGRPRLKLAPDEWRIA